MKAHSVNEERRKNITQLKVFSLKGSSNATNTL